MANNLPPLITTEGLVLNNQMPGEGALGNYTPKGTASSEGISLLMRGMLRAAIATQDPEKTAYANFLFDAACKYFFKDQRPPAAPGQLWNHSWICNGGAAFSVRGPLSPTGDLALSGYIHGRDPQSKTMFTTGVGQLALPPDIVYQVVSDDAKFVWPNVFSELKEGSNFLVDYYIDTKGNKVFGSQKVGSFGQPAIPAGQHSDGAPGKIVLTTPETGFRGVNYNITVPEVNVAYGELYEAWPMWRKLAAEEVSTAADAIHWFFDAFQLGKELDPANQDWALALDRMHEVWELTCKQESNQARIFQAGEDGQYNNFPLTYSFGYGRTNVDDPTTNWDAVPPTDKYTALRTSDGYVTFVMPAENAAIGSGGPIRYGVAFENNPLFLRYTGGSSLSVDVVASASQVLNATIESDTGEIFEANLLVEPTSTVQQVSMGQFLKFQQDPGDATGDKTGDWEDGPGDWEMPVYPTVPFPGRRASTVGDSITFYNAAYVPPKAPSGRFENYGSGFAGWWVNAEQILRGRTMLEHGIQPNFTGNHRGTSFAVAGTKVVNWWLPEDFPTEDGVAQVGPMYAALANLDHYDVCMMLGGTNDLSGNAKTAEVLLLLKKASTDIAKNGKWVFLALIPPRTRNELKGYTYEQQTVILQRLKEVNQGLRDWVATDKPGNIFLIDWWDKLVGPNGVDPAGLVSHASNPDGGDSLGNYRPDAPNLVFMHDGLHPGPAAGRVMGEVTADVMIAAGVPARVSNTTLGPLTLGPNLLSNPGFTFTKFDTTKDITNYNASDIGWAYGLGAQVKDGKLHNGFVHGKMPDNWHFYRSTNQTNIAIGAGVGGLYSNFMQFTYKDMVGDFPTIAQYMGDSTWPDGSVKTSIVMHEGVPALQIDVDMPVTGNKNESFVVVAAIPRRQHGPWDNYGYDGPDQNMVIPNTVYQPGDMIMAESDLILSGMNATCHSMQQVIYFYQNNATPGSSGDENHGSRRTSFGNHPFMYPPSDMDNIRFHTKDRAILLRSPAVVVPTPRPIETMRYTDFRYEFGFDASTVGPKARIIIKNPVVRKVTGGTPL